MKVRDLSIDKYGWSVKIFLSVTCYYTEYILESLDSIRCPAKRLHRVKRNLERRKLDTGFTYSNKRERKTVMVIGLSSSPAEFLNSFEHEVRHLVDDIAKTIGLEIAGEDVAYLTGDINTELWPDIHKFICCKCHE